VGGSARVRLSRAPSTRLKTRPTSREFITIDFERGDGDRGRTARRCRPATLLAKLNDLGRKHGIGRLDLVENRFVGMKSRGMYETPGGTILLSSRIAASSRSRSIAARRTSRTSSMPRYAELVYNGFWFAPEREMLQAAIDHSQARRSAGTVRLKLYKGSGPMWSAASRPIRSTRKRS
jgi:argininosuccinate synthase